MDRQSDISRKTAETVIEAKLNIDGTGAGDIAIGIPFFDHMLTLLAAHGFFDLTIRAKGDIEVGFHHTVEDVGLVLGDLFDQALGNREGIRRYGYAVTPMDEAIASVAVDLSKRPFLVYRLPSEIPKTGESFSTLGKEFFRVFATRGGMNLHIDVGYGENEHHIIEAVFKAVGRALDIATSIDDRIVGVHSTKGSL
ncbi:MAG: imidazoleglycerol-phosphate dehydratase HisB [Desulfobacterales bacterium]|nr:imidazoleglycerol-phosphate dehydratase HisB [Desulfobacterales bacterium]MDX2510455.1 imidazoleglycerol-phosphate dehydratase HisB [Desulfobacterales bacterium]